MSQVQAEASKMPCSGMADASLVSAAKEEKQEGQIVQSGQPCQLLLGRGVGPWHLVIGGEAVDGWGGG